MPKTNANKKTTVTSFRIDEHLKEPLRLMNVNLSQVINDLLQEYVNNEGKTPTSLQLMKKESEKLQHEISLLQVRHKRLNQEIKRIEEDEHKKKIQAIAEEASRWRNDF